jgi:hypothetical protein
MRDARAAHELGIPKLDWALDQPRVCLALIGSPGSGSGPRWCLAGLRARVNARSAPHSHSHTTPTPSRCFFRCASDAAPSMGGVQANEAHEGGRGLLVPFPDLLE